MQMIDTRARHIAWYFQRDCLFLMFSGKGIQRKMTFFLSFLDCTFHVGAHSTCGCTSCLIMTNRTSKRNISGNEPIEMTHRSCNKCNAVLLTYANHCIWCFPYWNLRGHHLVMVVWSHPPGSGWWLAVYINSIHNVEELRSDVLRVEYRKCIHIWWLFLHNYLLPNRVNVS